MATGISNQIGVEPDWDLEITEDRQGHYPVEEYLEMTASTNKLVELTQ